MELLMQVTNVTKDICIKCDGYTFRFEYNKDLVIVHLRAIDKFTKEIFLSMREQLRQWSDFIKDMGHEYLWAAVPEDNIKIQRLIHGLGFKFTNKNEGLNIYRYGV